MGQRITNHTRKKPDAVPTPRPSLSTDNGMNGSFAAITRHATKPHTARR